ncbi:cysteine desulfurase [Candidatus Peregrinibacteria bacterium]|nr:cysteine desulfurase [Candidatus Peregrinibacteria bacterium]
MKNFIYLDHAATTAVDPRVFAAMKPYFSKQYGNPSSIYQLGQKAKQAIDNSRRICSEILQCAPREIIFTSGGTESNNLFIFGAAQAYRDYGRHIIATKIEHDSVLRPLQVLEKQGFAVTYLDVDKNGIVKVSDVKKALRPDTIFVTIIYANNEIGTIQPIAQIGRMLNTLTPKPYFHTDACQAAAYLPLSVKKIGVDAMTLNSGKIYGPKGAGALFVKKSIDLMPQIFGGGQERALRAGTENVPAIVGFGEALRLALLEREAETKRLIPLRDKLISGIIGKIPNSRLNGGRCKRLPNNVNISFKGVDSNALLIRLDMLGIAASAGSACSLGNLAPPHVLQALKVPPEWICGTVRFSLGRKNTEQDIDFLLKKLPKIIEELREISPFA